ncbi:zinc finger CCCH domain-containing protein ZFN-like isoform X2 [Curcuma longa]|uniref:zinc finger CCCH domain-containing protein ZFN-like isoform X2 n=1 Tax=Curcuma longa TaxID=136217 RepID=UPI003D9DBEED
MTGDRDNAPSDPSSNVSPKDLEEPMKNFKIEEVDRKDDFDGRLNPYPRRPGEPDCKHYLRIGSCSFGSKCKYNHPSSTEEETNNRDELPQEDQPDCQFFLKTGFCKYGTICKYHHPKDKHALHLPLLNSFGLPLRKDMKSCSYFMKTGSCKFGIECKYDHPQPNNIGAMFPVPGPSIYGYAGFSATTGPHLTGGYSAWLTSWPPYVTSSYMEGLPAYNFLALPTNQTTMPIQPGWSTYMAPSTTTVSSVSSLGTNHTKPGSSTGDIFPERPNEPDCQYYLKTGTCKYTSSCKYNHPKGATQPTDCIIGPYGLPHRPDSPKCKHYATYGTCKYGPTCKFDHPIMAVYSLPGASEPYPFQDGTEITWIASNSSSFKVLKGLDQLSTSPETSGVQDVNTNEHDGRSSTLTSPNHPPNSNSGNQSDEG